LPNKSKKQDNICVHVGNKSAKVFFTWFSPLHQFHVSQFSTCETLSNRN